MIDRIVYLILEKISHVSSKISTWSWQKLWGNRKKGYGYKKKYDRKKLSNDNG